MVIACSVGGVALHFEDRGEGSALVFSNSLGTDFRVWDALLPYLPDGWRVVRYDKLGHGLSDLPEGRWTIEDHAADLAGLLDALGVTRAVVCGLSVGGMIAQSLAASRPDLVRGLVLCCTGARIGTPEVWDGRIAAIREGGLEAILDATMERWFTAAFRADPARLAPWRNMVRATPLEGYVRTAEAIRDADLRRATAALRLPCLAVAGAHDGSTPPDLVRETAALIPGSRFELIEDAAHIPCVERPERLGALIGGVLAELPG